jgi:hypothetical protein
MDQEPSLTKSSTNSTRQPGHTPFEAFDPPCNEQNGTENFYSCKVIRMIHRGSNKKSVFDFKNQIIMPNGDHREEGNSISQVDSKG